MPSQRYLTQWLTNRPRIPGNVYGDLTQGYGWRVVSHVPNSTCELEVISTQAVLDATDANANFIPFTEPEPTPWPARTTGGEGGDTHRVTNTNVSGEGSLAAALAAGSGKIVFDCAGTLDLMTPAVYNLNCDNPNVSILGDTAPGPGFCLKGRLTVRNHDVIVRNLRLRPGPGGSGNAGKTNGIILTDTALITPYNVWVDHVSGSWATDEIFTGYATFGNILYNVEFSYCLNYNALNDSTHPEGPHAFGFLFSNGWRDAAIHHTLFALNTNRNPQVGEGDLSNPARLLLANNVIYGCGEQAWLWGSLWANIVGNRVIAPGSYYDLELSNQSNSAGLSKVYIAGNDNPDRDWTIRNTDNETLEYPRASSALQMPDYISVTDAATAYEDVLTNAGAFPRDSADAAIVAHVRNRTGAVIDDPSEVGGWPDLSA